ncbi:hypothetical protein ACVNPX_10600 [Staphylococcus aureus]
MGLQPVILRAHGADTILTQHFLKDDVDTYINRSELIRTVKVEDNGIAIAHGSDDKIYHPVTVAQAADELLSLEGIEDVVCCCENVKII